MHCLPLRFFAKEAQNDRMRVQNDKVAAQCDREFVILNAVKDLAPLSLRFFAGAQNDNLSRVFCHPDGRRILHCLLLRFFAKEAQNDRVCGFVILNAVKDLALFTIKILRKRGSE